MATRKEIINLQVQYKSLEGLNEELNQTRKELEGLAIGSKEFKDMTQKVQGLEAALNDVNTEIEGFTADKKFLAADGAIKAFGGSIAATVGSMGLLGIETEKLGALEEKAASALSLAVGLKDVSEGFKQIADSQALAALKTKAFSAATKVMTAVQKGFNAVMAMNPLGLLIVGLTTAAVLIYKFRDSILEAIKSFGPFNWIIEKITGAMQSLGEAIGLVDDEQTKQTKANIARMEEELAIAQAKGEATKQMELDLLLERRKLLEQGTDEYKESLVQEKVFKAEIEKEKTDTEKAENDKRNEQAKAAAEKRKQQLEANENAYLAVLKKLADEELNLQADTAQKKLQLELDRQIAEIDALQVSEDKKTELKLQAQENYNTKLNELLDTQAEENQEKEIARQQANKDRELELQALEAESILEKRDADIAAVEEDYNRRIDIAKKAGEDTTVLEKIKAKKIEDINKATTEQQEQLAEQEAQFKEAIVNQSIDNIQGALQSLFGESKAVASANVIVDAGQAAVGILKQSTKGIPAPLAPVFIGSQLALLAATTVKSLKDINSAKPGGGGGGGAVPSRRSAPPMNMSAPQALPDTVETPEIEAPAVKAYVVQGDVRSASEADAKINSRRTLTN